MNNYIEEVNKRLSELTDTLKEGPVKEAMKYSIMAGGKRIRPLLFIWTLRSYDMDYHPFLDVACAIEMIHTYSLIHDDLPGMDNDDLRRGQPTCHKKFDEATAILAGDALLNEAMNVMLKLKVTNDLKVTLMNEMFQASGACGMIYGQQQDMYFEKHQASLEELKEIHHFKTGCLLSLPLVLGALIARKEDVETLRKVGFNIGLAFQIQDDILDVTSDEETLGKPVGSDISNHKSTYVSLLGVEKSRQWVDDLFVECIADIYSLRLNHGLMIQIIESIRKRVN